MIVKTVRVPAPAKVNLFLRVLGRRDDGFHNIQTWIQLLDYSDELVFTPRDDDRIQMRIESLARLDAAVSDSDNLVLQAAAALRTRCPDKTAGVDVLLRKRIPAGAGLGGGSSDAATTLCALNQLWQCGLSRPELCELGAALGADVPVFVNGETAWATGIGDQLTAAPLPEAWYVILVPEIGISTAQMFQSPELTRDCQPITKDDYRAGYAGNVFEPLVRKRCPQAGEMLDWLAQHGRAFVTGSGSSVFASFSEQGQAAAVMESKPPHWSGFVAKGLNQSPLGDVLGQIF